MFTSLSHFLVRSTLHASTSIPEFYLCPNARTVDTHEADLIPRNKKHTWRLPRSVIGTSNFGKLYSPYIRKKKFCARDMFTFTVPQYILTYKFQKPNNAQTRKLIYVVYTLKKKQLGMNIRSVSKHFTSILANRFNSHSNPRFKFFLSITRMWSLLYL
jgi:hypothetical protein